MMHFAGGRILNFDYEAYLVSYVVDYFICFRLASSKKNEGETCSVGSVHVEGSETSDCEANRSGLAFHFDSDSARLGRRELVRFLEESLADQGRRRSTLQVSAFRHCTLPRTRRSGSCPGRRRWGRVVTKRCLLRAHPFAPSSFCTTSNDRYYGIAPTGPTSSERCLHQIHRPGLGV